MRRRSMVLPPIAGWILSPIAALSAACGGGGTEPGPTVAAVTVTLAASTLSVGQTTQATAIPRDGSGNALTGKAITWRSSNAAVATVSASGLVTAAGAGSADIEASSDGRTGEASLTVLAPVATVAVSLAATTIDAGQTTQATATLRDAQGNTLTGRAVAWTSSNTGIATVSSGGLVAGVAEGQVNIVATSEGVPGQAALTVEPDPSSQPQIDVLGVTRNGAAVDLQRAAGTVTVEVDQSIPAGFRGTITFRVGSDILRQDSLIGPAMSQVGGGGAPAAARSLALYAINLATIVATPTTGSLTARAVVLNTSQQLDAAISGLRNGVPVTASTSLTLTGSHPNALLIWLADEGATAQDADGHERNLHGVKEIVTEVDFGAAAAISQVQVLTGGFEAEYGPGATAGAVNLVTTRDRSEFGQVRVRNESNARFASRSEGSAWRFGAITRGGLTTRAYETTEVFQGVCFSLDYSGLPTLDTQAALPLPAGCNLHAVIDGWDPVTVNGVEFHPAVGPKYIDWSPPNDIPGALQPPVRTSTILGPAYNTRGVRCCSGNRINGNMPVDVLLNVTLDIDPTLDLSRTRWYATDAANIATLHQPGNLITSLAQIPNGPNKVIGATFVDAANRTFNDVVAVNAANPLTLNGQTSTNHGVDPAVFDVYTQTPTASIDAFENTYTLPSTFSGTFSYRFNFTPAQGVPATGWDAGGFVRFESSSGNEEDLVGSEQNPALLATGSSPIQVPVFAWQSAALTLRGSFTGRYKYVPYVWDPYGNEKAGDPGSPFQISAHSGQPAVELRSQFPDPAVPGDPVTLTVDANDGWSVREIWAGVHPTGSTDWQCLFLGRVNVRDMMYPDLRVSGASRMVTFRAPKSIYAADQFGVVGAPVGWDAVCAAAVNESGNASPIMSWQVGPFTPTPIAPAPANDFAIGSPATFTTGSTLTSGGAPTGGFFRGDLRTPSLAPDFFESDRLSIRVGALYSRPIGNASTRSAVNVGGSNFLRTDYNFTGKDLGLTLGGTYTFNRIGQTSDGHTFVGPSVTYSVQVQPFLVNLQFFQAPFARP